MSEHHPTCKPSHMSLVWHCSRCGLNESAEGDPQEWTPESVKALVGYDIGGSGVIARAHNAALATKQAEYDMMVHAACVDNATIDKLQEQLTAERETSRLIKTAKEEKYQGALHHMEACRALLNVPDDEVLYQAIKDLQEQLATEREKVKALEEALPYLPPPLLTPGSGVKEG